MAANEHRACRTHFRVIRKDDAPVWSSARAVFDRLVDGTDQPLLLLDETPELPDAPEPPEVEDPPVELAPPLVDVVPLLEVRPLDEATPLDVVVAPEVPLVDEPVSSSSLVPDVDDLPLDEDVSFS
jgi:hypothetical protein